MQKHVKMMKVSHTHNFVAFPIPLRLRKTWTFTSQNFSLFTFREVFDIHMETRARIVFFFAIFYFKVSWRFYLKESFL